jgi:hypothetical protein
VTGGIIENLLARIEALKLEVAQLRKEATEDEVSPKTYARAACARNNDDTGQYPVRRVGR